MAEDIDTISFFHIRQPHVSPRLLQDLAYIGRPLPPQILPQNGSPPVDLSVGDIRWIIMCSQTVSDSVMVTVGSLHETRPIIALSNGTIADPCDLPFPKRGPKCTAQDQFRDACYYLANMTEDIDEAAVRCTRCYYEPGDVSPFAKLLWPLLPRDAL